MNSTTIDVVVSLASPMHVAYPENYSEGLSRTIAQPINIDGKRQYLPYYPANGFRGGLRRAIADMIADNIAAVESAISGDLYNGLHCGASSGSPDQTAKSIEEIIRARGHVYMGLFGGGARGHESMYAVSDMVPILDATIRTGMVPERYRENYVTVTKTEDNRAVTLQPNDLIGKRHFVRVDDLYRVADPESIQRTVADPVGTVTGHQERVGVNKADRKDGDENVVKEDVANLQSIQMIAPGTPMYFRIDVKRDATKAQVGALIIGLAQLFNENNFGCMGRWGFGRIRVLDIAVTIGGEVKRSVDSALYVGDVFTIPDSVEDLVNQANKEIKAIRKADIEEFFKDFSADKKAAKKAKGAAKAAATA